MIASGGPELLEFPLQIFGFSILLTFPVCVAVFTWYSAARGRIRPWAILLLPVVWLLCLFAVIVAYGIYQAISPH